MSHSQWRWKEFESGGGGTGPERFAEKNFFGRALHFFGSKSTIIRSGERFCDGQYSFVSFFACCSTHGALPRAQPFVKVRGGAHASRAPWSRRHWPRFWTRESDRDVTLIARPPPPRPRHSSL